jgi:hypothetical protein
VDKGHRTRIKAERSKNGMNEDELDAAWQAAYEAACQADMDGRTDAELEMLLESDREDIAGWLRQMEALKRNKWAGSKEAGGVIEEEIADLSLKIEVGCEAMARREKELAKRKAGKGLTG